MASTQYTTMIELYKGVPFTPSYEHTLYPARRGDKQIWLSENYEGKLVENIMLVKYNTGTGEAKVRLSIDAESSNSYNYCYINDNRGKEFFAFIMGAEYINDSSPVDGTSYVTMEFTLLIDVMMTYLLDNRNFAECMLNRHTAWGTDYNNEIPEEMPFPTGNIFEHDAKLSNGNYMDGEYNHVTGSLNDVSVLMAWQCATYFNTEDVVRGAIGTTMVGKVPTAYQYSLLHYDGSVDQWIAHNIGQLYDPAQMCGVWLVPSLAYKDTPTHNDYGVSWTSGDRNFVGLKLDYTNHRESLFWTAVDYENGYKIRDYIPRHSKTLMYPYHYARLYDNTGSYVDLQFEKWKDASLESVGYVVEIEVPNIPPVTIKAGPIYYDECGKNRCYHKSVSFGDYPAGSWSVDAWLAYLSQNRNVLMTQMVTDGIKMAGGFALGAFVPGTELFAAGLMVNGTTGMFNRLMQMQDMTNRADVVGGVTNPAFTDWIFGNMDLRCCVRSVSTDVAKKIDEYFDRYGYSQGGAILKPQCFGDLRYTFISTMGDCFDQSSIKAGAATAEEVVINTAMQRGVTFWNLKKVEKGGVFKYGDPSSES